MKICWSTLVLFMAIVAGCSLAQAVRADSTTNIPVDKLSLGDKSITYGLNAADLSGPKMVMGHLKMGGKNPKGQEITANNLYFSIDGKPVLPVMGEFHFSRYPRQYWEESILKMKADGVDIIATYVFWIYHEEIEDQFDWAGNNDLRYFLELCSKHNMYVFLRIGPWDHGECRNGGFPDWLDEKCKARTLDPVYFSYVRKLYAEIFKQTAGLLYKDGGSVIGVQLENEFMHVGGNGGNEYMMILKKMAKDIGFDVPLYTATGWGRTPIPEDEFIPVQAGYPDAPWAEDINKLPPSEHFVFSSVALGDATIGSDAAEKTRYNTVTTNNYDVSRYPFATAELAGGIMDTYHRRPIIAPEEIYNIALTKLGSGANLIGYYMFHGGSHRVGRGGPLQEDGNLRYPEISYDFQAPIGEYGQIADSYRDLKMLHLFLNDFGDILAPMYTVLPAKLPASPADTNMLRYAIRTKDGEGFLFVNNYQVRTRMQDFNNVRFALTLKGEQVEFPRNKVKIKSGQSFIWPFNLKLDGPVLKYSTTQPLCKIETNTKTTYVFFAPDGIAAEYAFDKATLKDVNVTKGEVSQANRNIYISSLEPGTNCVININATSGKEIRILTLTQLQAKQFWKAQMWGQERIFLTSANLLFDKELLRVYTTDAAQMSFSVFPDPEKKLYDGIQELKSSKDGVFAQYSVSRNPKTVSVNCKNLGLKFGVREWFVEIPADVMEGVNDVFLRIYYSGDIGKAYFNRRGFTKQTNVVCDLISDNFYNGLPWEIGLKRFAPKMAGKKLMIQITPFFENADIYLEKQPMLENGKAARVDRIEAIPEYEAVIGIVSQNNDKN